MNSSRWLNAYLSQAVFLGGVLPLSGLVLAQRVLRKRATRPR